MTRRLILLTLGAAFGQEVYPSFPGTVKGTDGKGLNLEVEGGNELYFRCTKKTVWMEGDKRLKPGAVKAGDLVVVEGRKMADGSMDAVRVLKQRPPA